MKVDRNNVKLLTELGELYYLNKEEENADDIPSKGVSRPSCKLEKIKLVSWFPKLSPLITLLTEPTVPINPQNVPKRPKNIKSPIRYLDISLLSSKRPATPSNTDLNAAAEMEKFFKFDSLPSI